MPAAAALIVVEIVADVAPSGGLAPRDQVEAHVVGEERAHAVPVMGVEESGIAFQGRRRRRRARRRQGRGVGLVERGAAAMQRCLDRGNAQAQLGRDLVDRMLEHVLQDDAAALRRRQGEERRDRGAHRLLARDDVVRLERDRVGDVERGIERLARAQRLVAPVVDRAVVSDAKQPWPQQRQLLQLRQLEAGARQRLLDHVLAVGDRARHSRAVAQQLGTNVVDEGEELAPRLFERADDLARRGGVRRFCLNGRRSHRTRSRSARPGPARRRSGPSRRRQTPGTPATPSGHWRRQPPRGRRCGRS